MGDKKWEDLPVDCLVDIFVRVDLESLLGVQFVCKSWYNATLSPLCWQSIIFPDELSASMIELFMWECDLDAFVKFVIRRSHGSATVFAFPPYFILTHQALNTIADGFPNLKRLVLPINIQLDDMSLISSVICKWKNLEALEINGENSLLERVRDPAIYECKKLEEYIPEISVHCKKLVSLSLVDVGFGQSEAYAIAKLLPNIEFLSFRRMWIERDDLVVILKGCKKLVHLDAGECLFFEVDDEIRKLAAHIQVWDLGRR